jgi:hypothetical protein
MQPELQLRERSSHCVACMVTPLTTTAAVHARLKMLESSYEANEPLSFEVGAGDMMGNKLFQGFDEAVRGLAVGQRTELEVGRSSLVMAQLTRICRRLMPQCREVPSLWPMRWFLPRPDHEWVTAGSLHAHVLPTP